MTEQTTPLDLDAIEARAEAALAEITALADEYDETERYSGQPSGDVPVARLRTALARAEKAGGDRD